ncbi:YlaI family protein [Bacillus sp. B-jedd]|uniref:YlaI family protein n=1 Tax=Bacillus sp. B-jedd TaxID=1476857 RepID=UPI0006629507|nr:YlaI family protein [Bacillus sp. B-jedd]
MRVKCVLCDKIETIPDDSPDAKRLRNRPIHTYMCIPCHDRISTRTSERLASGKFRLYRTKKEQDDF